jgi:predicted transcriptional regulator
MMFLQDDAKKILNELRHGPLTLGELCQRLDRAEFYVRAELLRLARERLVSERWRAPGYVWELSNKGATYAWGQLQTEIRPGA